MGFDMATKEEWVDRLESDHNLLMDGIEWLSESEAKRNVSQDNRIGHILLLKLCKAYQEGFTPTSDVMEGIGDNFAEVISEYSQFRADQDLNDEAEASAAQRMSATAFFYMPKIL